MKYTKYHVVAEGTIEISNANSKDVKDSTVLIVEGLVVNSKVTVKRTKK